MVAACTTAGMPAVVARVMHAPTVPLDTSTRAIERTDTSSTGRRSPSVWRDAHGQRHGGRAYIAIVGPWSRRPFVRHAWIRKRRCICCTAQDHLTRRPLLYTRKLYQMNILNLGILAQLPRRRSSNRSFMGTTRKFAPKSRTYSEPATILKTLGSAYNGKLCVTSGRAPSRRCISAFGETRKA